MRFGKAKAHAGQACRVSELNGRIFLVLGKPAFSLLLLWAAFWSIHIVVKSNAFAQDIPLALTTPAIQSAIKDNDAYTHAWWSEVHELSTNGALRKSEIAYASDRRLGNTLFRDRNQFVSRPFTGKCHAKGDGSTTEKNISATPGAPNTEDQVLSKYGSRSPTKGYADSPRYSLLAIGDWFRVRPLWCYCIENAIRRPPFSVRRNFTSRRNADRIRKDNSSFDTTPNHASGQLRSARGT
jgi:hypothetical protein